MNLPNSHLDNQNNTGHTISDSSVLQKYISERLDQSFGEIYRFYDEETLELKAADDSESVLEIFQENITYNLKNLCREKIWRASTDKLRHTEANEIFPRPYNQSEVISIIWEILKARLSSIFSRQINHYLCDTNLGYPGINSLIDNWASSHNNAKILVKSILAFFGYIPINYPQLVKRSSPNMLPLDYFEVLFISSIKEKLQCNFFPFLEDYIFACFDGRISEEDMLKTESPILLLYKYKTFIFVDAEFSFRDFYSATITKYVQNRIDVHHDVLYLENLALYLQKNAFITGLVSIALIEFSNSIILNNTVLRQATIVDLLSVFKDHIPLEFGTQKSKTFNEIAGYMESLLTVYTTRGRLCEFESAYQELINSTLNSMTPLDSKTRKLDLAKRFEECCKLILIMDANETLKSYGRKKISECMGGAIKLLESYVSFCDVSIRKSNKEVTNSKNELSVLKSKEALILHVPTVLELDSAFLKPYCQSLFRRAIFSGLRIFETLTSPKFLEYHLLMLVERDYRKSSFYQGLQSLKSEILKSCKSVLDFNEEHELQVEFNAFLFNRTCVPEVFRCGENEMLHLPESLKLSWDKYLMFLERYDGKVDHKTINPIYQLQFCEVETPYLLRNGKYLILDLTVIQTSVISLFNEENLLTCKDISAKTRIKDDSLRDALASFQEVGILRVENDMYSLNADFTPDEDKIKNDKLRILLGRGTRAKSEKDNTIGSQHKEGNRGHWAQELLKACIVRSIKARRGGLTFDFLFKEVTDQIQGISIGDFKEALNMLLRDKFIRQEKNLYKY